MSQKMKSFVLVFVVAFAFSTTAMAVDIGISTQANWWSQGAADREMQEIVDNVTTVSVERFAADEQDALADWVEAHTGNGISDILILCGAFPDTIYEPGNTQADDSIAELFLDDGNCIVNTGDYMFYVVNGAGTNAAGGLQTMMDIPGITMWDPIAVTVTPDGQDFTPTLTDLSTDRPFHLDELQDDWEVELILAQNDDGTRADPVVVVNQETGGRLAIFYQTSSRDDDPRGEVISEWINNWYLKNIAGGGNPLARRPEPKDGTLHEDTWISLSWRPGNFAVSHDVYFGDNFDAVNEGAEGTFFGNQVSTNFVAGFPGFAYPDGLVPGTTYYWRIDEVNETEPNSPWKGDVWSFGIPPKTAYAPDPADGAEAVAVDTRLEWTAGFGGKLHTVYFGDNFDEVDNAAGGLPQGITTFDPGPLEMAKTYYWRVDEFDAIDTYKGNVWSFTTEGAVTSLDPVNGAVDVTQTPILTWAPGLGASHEVYFGADAASLELKGSGNLGSESYETGLLEWNTTYYWRIDEANNANANSPWTGPLWSFTTANFLIIDDMESYNDLDPADPASNRLFLAWIDRFDDPTNGSLVGYANPPFAEQSNVHSGNQSMPFEYNNAVGKSEATLTLTSNSDWTVKGVNRVTIWYRGRSTNDAEPMYAALNDSAVVTNDNPGAAQKTSWTEWSVDLQAFADQGVNLANVTSITLGLGSRSNPVAGGAGTLFFDDIRLYAPAE
ncbi:MAG: hypothetical protein GY774_17030 [Planctomycetes bacterium]|nr:hypothetical protein [Planctomycetota bacterium]